MAEKFATPVGHSQLDGSELICANGLGPTAEGLAHAYLNRLIGPDGHTANLVGALKGWGCTLAASEPDGDHHE
jgi:hypothetical protein